MIKTIIISAVIATAISGVFFAGMGCTFGFMGTLDPETGERFRNKLKNDLRTESLGKRMTAVAVLIGEKIGRHMAKNIVEE